MSDNFDPNGSTPEPGFHSSDLLFPMPSKEDIKKNGIFYYVLSEQERVFYAMVRNSEGLKDVMELVEAKILYIMCVYPGQHRPALACHTHPGTAPEDPEARLQRRRHLKTRDCPREGLHPNEDPHRADARRLQAIRLRAA